MTALEDPPPLDTRVSPYLASLSAADLLRSLPIPVVAVQADSTIAYHNEAFGQLLGDRAASLVGIAINTLWRNASGLSPFAALRDSRGSIEVLQHGDEHCVRVVFSRSVFLREDDPIVLVAVHDLTDQLWVNRDTAVCPPGFAPD